MAALSQKFASLMNRPAEVSPAENTEPTAIGKFLVQHDEALRNNKQEIADLSKVDTSDLTDQEKADRNMALVDHIASVQFEFNAVVFVAQSSKNGFQTLMRNQ